MCLVSVFGDHTSHSMVSPMGGGASLVSVNSGQLICGIRGSVNEKTPLGQIGVSPSNLSWLDILTLL